ncbi:MAG TPA: hypothetical protein VGM18_10080 [Candidatus Sulfotelmatobacter sp.]
MTGRSNRLFTAAGSLALAIGLTLHLWAGSDFSHFASGFFLGVSIALLILGLTRPSRRTWR